jgi:hypothetical protein
VTRFVDGLEDNLAMQTGKSGARVLQLVDLHGDVMTTVPIRDGEPTRTGRRSGTRPLMSSATPPT